MIEQSRVRLVAPQIPVQRESEPNFTGDPRSGVAKTCIGLDTILARIHRLPMLSSCVVRVLQMMESSLVSAREITSVIEADPAFAMRLVKAANAPCYKLPRIVGTVSDVVFTHGIDTFREVVLTAALRDILGRQMPGYELSSVEMWSHSLACGAAAEIIAKATGYRNTLEAYIAGVLHDVGKIVLDEDVRESKEALTERMDRAHCGLIDAERVVLGFDHCDVGGRIIRNWGLSQQIVNAIALQRKPVSNRQTVPLAGYVHLGEMLCSLAGFGLGIEGLQMTLETQVLTDFKLSTRTIDESVNQLLDAMASSHIAATHAAGASGVARRG